MMTYIAVCKYFNQNYHWNNGL